jgi:hypothetical protein
MAGRSSREIRRRFDVAVIFPDRKPAVQLELDDKWVSVSGRYISLDAMDKVCPGWLTLLE